MKKIQKLTAALLAGVMTVCPLSFAAFAEDSADTEENFLLGDANLDGKIDTFDAYIALAICVDQLSGLYYTIDNDTETLYGDVFIVNSKETIPFTYSKDMTPRVRITNTYYIDDHGNEITVSTFDAQIILNYSVERAAGRYTDMTISEFVEAYNG